jgi:hypothetical protein
MLVFRNSGAAGRRQTLQTSTVISEVCPGKEAAHLNSKIKASESLVLLYAHEAQRPTI